MRHTISNLVHRLSSDDFSYVAAVVLERIRVKKPGEENNIEINVQTSRVLRFATDLFKGNMRVSLQYSVK